jgi:hypothetical protein
MPKLAYHIATREESNELSICEEYDVLLGPEGFVCVLGEAEDRFWFRDASPVIDALNEQHAENAKLREKIKGLRRTARNCAQLRERT